MQTHISIVKQSKIFPDTFAVHICIREPRKIEGTILEVFACTIDLLKSLELEMWVFCP